MLCKSDIESGLALTDYLEVTPKRSSQGFHSCLGGSVIKGILTGTSFEPILWCALTWVQVIRMTLLSLVSTESFP